MAEELTAAERYREFLQSPFWRELSLRKRRLVGKCQRCGSRQHLQSHHWRYPKDWFQTTENDLEVLCRICHAKHHRKVPDWKPAGKVKSLARTERRMGKALREFKSGNPSWKSICYLRSKHLIDRAKFDEMRKAVGMDQASKQARELSKSQRRYERWHPGMYEGISATDALQQVGKPS